MILADQRTDDASGPPKAADRRCQSTDDRQATTMNKVLINRHNRRVNKYFIFVLALTLFGKLLRSIKITWVHHLPTSMPKTLMP
jgi:predicted cation transporter